MTDIHTCKDGRKIPIRDMGDDHLRNTIAYWERRAEEGVCVLLGDPHGEPWAWEEWYYGEDALALLNYQAYVDELHGRAND